MAGTVIPGGIVHPTAPTMPASSSSTNYATTEFTTAIANTKADLLSPTLTGTPRAPTAATAARDNQIATTQFVVNVVNAAIPLPTTPTVTAPSVIYGGSQANLLSATGSTTVIGGPITYSIINIPSQLTFSKTEGLAAGEQVTFSVENISADIALTVQVVAVVGGVRRSAPRTVNMSAVALPTVVGQPFQGGFYFGRYQIGSNEYALIVSPRSSGQNTNLAGKTANTPTAGTASTADGLANSNASNNATHPAAAWCRSLNIGGYIDWYLGAQNEIELLYRALKPFAGNNITGYKAPGDPDSTSYGLIGVNPNSIPNGSQYTTIDPAQSLSLVFRSGGTEALPADGTYVMTSSQNAGATATGTKMWVQSFGGPNAGLQTLLDKTNSAGVVRAIRRVRIN